MMNFRDRLAAHLVNSAVERGADRAAAEATVADMTKERPILDWLFNEGGFEKLLALVLKLLPLFLAAPAPPAA